MKQTAVEWLQDKLNNVKPTQFCSIETIKEWVEQAKEMERQQIIDSIDYCRDKYIDSENYYNKTFNK